MKLEGTFPFPACELEILFATFSYGYWTAFIFSRMTLLIFSYYFMEILLYQMFLSVRPKCSGSSNEIIETPS